MASDPYKYFRLEARELLQQLGKGALELERGEPAAERVAQLLRLAHTLKGAARVVKQREMADLAHAIEDALEPFRAQAGAAPRQTVETVRKLVDQVGARVVALDAPAAEKSVPATVSARRGRAAHAARRRRRGRRAARRRRRGARATGRAAPQPRSA